jgi:hypothetical protein
MMLAEANQWPEDTKEYFGQGDECHMAFHFPLMPRMYMALAREDRFPITDIMRQTPQIPDNCQWAIFLRNHDELTLEMVTDSERDYLWETYAKGVSPSQKRRGGQPKPFWAEAKDHVFDRLDHHGLPSPDDPVWSNQAAVEKDLNTFLSKKGWSVAESTIRKYVVEFIREWSLRKRDKPS